MASIQDGINNLDDFLQRETVGAQKLSELELGAIWGLIELSHRSTFFLHWEGRGSLAEHHGFSY